MCVSAGAAELSGTILFAGRRLHRVHGWVEVLGYHNVAVNLAAELDCVCNCWLEVFVYRIYTVVLAECLF